MVYNDFFTSKVEKKSLKINKVKNSRVILRVDLNVPLGEDGSVLNISKIRNIAPTLNELLKNNNKIIVVTHLGRPINREPRFSTKAIIPHLRDVIENSRKIEFLPWVENLMQYKRIIDSCEEGKIFVLENIRFFEGEVENDEGFSRQLASIANIFVNDAFACCHRNHASVCGISKFLKSYFGLALVEEVSAINNFMCSAFSDSNLTIVGGAKLETKLGLIKSLSACSFNTVVGGGVASYLMKNFYSGERNCLNINAHEDCKLRSFLHDFGGKIVVPVDVCVTNEVDTSVRVVNAKDVKKDDKICDIGIKTVSLIESLISQSKTVIWNGPLGICEDKRFDIGTKSVATIIANLTASGKVKSLSGGGETMVFLEKWGLNKMFTHISTGGGAMLKYIEFSGEICGLNSIVK